LDNLTHSLVGVFLARAGLNSLAPDAMPILLLAANAPDIDVVGGLGGAAMLLQWHRSWTHSLAFSLVLAVAAVALVRIFSKIRTGWISAIAAAWIGVLSHLLLDLTNNYGVRLLEPFSSRWFEWDITFVIDPRSSPRY
jgi:inner membrane protein